MNRFIITLFISCIFTFVINAQSDTISIKNESKKTNVKVFPNPATNVVNVLGLQNSHTSNIIILDTYGNVKLRHTWAIKNNAINIPISSLLSGIYIITIHSKEQHIQTKFYKK